MRRIVTCLNVLLIFSLWSASIARGESSKIEDMITISCGYAMSLSIHELGHAVVAGDMGAQGLSLNLGEAKAINLWGAATKVDRIKKKYILPFAMGGEIGSDFCFESALALYRRSPNLLNKSILFFSGTDFLRYCLYSFYIDKENEYADPYIVKEETHLNQNIILSIALLKTVINTQRIMTKKDTIIPYFTYKKDSVLFNLLYKF